MVNRTRKQITIEESRRARGLPPIERDEQGRPTQNTGIVEPVDVGAREKQKSKLIQQGVSPTAAERQLTRQEGAAIQQQNIAATEPISVIEQKQQEAARKEPFVQAVQEDALAQVDRIQNLASAGVIPAKAAAIFLESTLPQVFGLKPFKTEEEIRADFERAFKGPEKVVYAGIGFGLTTGINVGDTKISASALFSRRGELAALRSDASSIRETSEAALKAARDSEDYDSAINVYETLIEANRFKHSEIQRIMRDNPDDVANGVTDATSMLRDQNRLITDLGIIERAKLTGNKTELINRVKEIESRSSNTE